MNEETRKHILFEEFELDADHRQLLREGEPVALYAKTFDLLSFLVENSGRILSKDEILDGVWSGQFVEEANLSVQISALRKALGENAAEPRFLVTIPGKGYKFVADVQNSSSAITIEKHSLSKIIIEEEIDDGRVVDAQAVSSSSKSWKKIVVFSAGTLVLLFLVLGGNWFYRNRSRTVGIPASESRELESIKRVSNTGRVSSASISPDGKFVVFKQNTSAGSGTVFIQQLDTNAVRQLIEPSEKTFGCTNFSPDGSLVYYVAADKNYPANALYSVPVLGGTPKLVVSNLGRCFTISPDGKRVAFFRSEPEAKQKKLMLAELNGEEDVLLSRKVDELIFGRGLAWSPDGDSIVFGADSKPRDGVANKMVFEANVSDGAVKQVSEERFLDFGKMVWTSGGDKLAYVAKRLNDENQLYLMEYPSGKVRRMTGEMGHYVYSGLGITKDSNTLVADLIERKEEIWRVDADGGASRAVRIRSGTSNGRLGITTLPDGRIAYISGSPSSLDVWTAKEDGSETKPLTQDKFRQEDVAGSPDGRYLVFSSNRAGANHIFRMNANDGSQIKQLTFGERSDDHPSVSSDNKWVVYASSDGKRTTIWKVPISGGESVQLTDYESGLPVYSPDGKNIACVILSDSAAKPSTIAVIPAKGGKPIKSFQVKPYQDYDYPIHWTEDGKAITFANWHKNAFNLWQQPLTGDSPRQLVDFPTGSTWNFAPSRDGKYIFLSRGTTFIDVVVINNFLQTPGMIE